jgi:hypothetical protein
LIIFSNRSAPLLSKGIIYYSNTAAWDWGLGCIVLCIHVGAGVYELLGLTVRFIIEILAWTEKAYFIGI